MKQTCAEQENSTVES